jgi:penicillin-binding protein-related factor A (putative recombinase)
MKEKDINTIIAKSLNVIGKKISDGGKGSKGRFSQNPCDGFGVHEINGTKKNVYFESKFNSKMKAFNVNRIEPHQANALDKFSQGEGSLCVVPLGVHAKRNDLRIYLFLWSLLRDHYYSSETIVYENIIYYIPHKEKTITKKVLEILPYEKVKNGVIPFKTFISSL